MTVGRSIGLGAFAIMVLFFLSLFFGSWFTVDEGQRGVVLRNGSFVEVVNPGLGYKLPIVDTVVDISVRESTLMFDKIQVYSRDQQTINAVISVTYNIPLDQVEKVYRYYGSRENLENRVLNRQVNERAEIIFGKYSAPDIPKNRQQISMELSAAIKDVVKNSPIMISSIQLENIDFADNYEKSIAARMEAEVKVKEAKQIADQAVEKARQTVTEAQAKADSTLAQATADARSIELRGTAEANAINARGKALRENPNVVALVQAEKWDGKLPSQMIPGSAVPFLQLQQPAQ